MSDKDDTIIEEMQVKGEDVLAKIKELVREGNVRRIAIKNPDGESIIEIPLTIGVVGAILVPTLAAIGAVAALVTDCTITVERVDEDVHDATEADGG